ncbi:MAG: ankyrin repeat domain-containing protein, partial [Planctomycetota bacterium]
RHENLVSLLLEKGANVTAKTNNGLTPLKLANMGE